MCTFGELCLSTSPLLSTRPLFLQAAVHRVEGLAAGAYHGEWTDLFPAGAASPRACAAQLGKRLAPTSEAALLQVHVCARPTSAVPPAGMHSYLWPYAPLTASPLLAA